MKSQPLVLSIDQGTTGTTVLVVGNPVDRAMDENLTVLGRGYCEIPQSYPAPGQVEHDPEAIWRSVLTAFEQARAPGLPGEIVAVGLTNQRETTVLWDRQSGRPVAPAIVWQDRRTADMCDDLRRAAHEPRVREVTGLVLDPYFSATKIRWMLDHVPGLRARAEAGQVAFGTVDSYLVWRLTGGQAHITDVSNASRTLLFDLRKLEWSPEMCALFGVPRAILPRVVPSSGRLAATQGLAGVADGTPISGLAGDQQAALFGQDCLRPGDAKCTFGTGSFLLMNVGPQPVTSQHRLLGTVAWATPGGKAFALEGSAFISGALVQWLRDGLGILKSAAESESLAASVPDDGGVTIVPALSGLGAPYWRPEARGAVFGLSRGTTAGHIARAALQAMALQNVDLVRAMERDAGHPITALRVDGGATKNDLLMQIQADLLGTDILRPAQIELTAIGAAKLAGMGIGLELGAAATNSSVETFHPKMSAERRESILCRWRACVDKA